MRTAAHGDDEHILVRAGHARVAAEHGQQHGQPVAVQAHGQATRRGAALIDQGLYLHQHGARALQRDQHAGAGHGLACAGTGRWRWGWSRP